MELGRILAGVAGVLSLAAGLMTLYRRQSGLRSRPSSTGPGVSVTIALDRTISVQPSRSLRHAEHAKVVIHDGLTTEWEDTESLLR